MLQKSSELSVVWVIGRVNEQVLVRVIDSAYRLVPGYDVYNIYDNNIFYLFYHLQSVFMLEHISFLWTFLETSNIANYQNVLIRRSPISHNTLRAGQVPVIAGAPLANQYPYGRLQVASRLCLDMCIDCCKLVKDNFMNKVT